MAGRARLRRLPDAAWVTSDAFQALGEDEATARVLGALLGHRRLRLDEVSRRAGLVGSAVRGVLQGLEERGWVLAERVSTGKRGNPPLAYTLVENRGVLVEYYQRQAKRHIIQAFKSAQPW